MHTFDESSPGPDPRRRNKSASVFDPGGGGGGGGLNPVAGPLITWTKFTVTPANSVKSTYDVTSLRIFL